MTWTIENLPRYLLTTNILHFFLFVSCRNWLALTIPLVSTSLSLIVRFEGTIHGLKGSDAAQVKMSVRWLWACLVVTSRGVVCLNIQSPQDTILWSGEAVQRARNDANILNSSENLLETCEVLLLRGDRTLFDVFSAGVVILSSADCVVLMSRG